MAPTVEKKWSIRLPSAGTLAVVGVTAALTVAALVALRDYHATSETRAVFVSALVVDDASTKAHASLAAQLDLDPADDDATDRYLLEQLARLDRTDVELRMTISRMLDLAPPADRARLRVTALAMLNDVDRSYAAIARVLQTRHNETASRLLSPVPVALARIRAYLTTTIVR